jgi:hypothetical protein
MWNEKFGKEIARILTLMADMPDSKPDPDGGGNRQFEGGQVIVNTGVTTYKFSDGSEARYGTGRGWHLTIKSATGDKVDISVENRKCSQCGSEFWLGDRFCRRCGQK